MIEVQVIHALLKRQAWLDYSGVLDWPALRQQTPEIHKVLLALKKWHEQKDSDLGIKELPTWFFLCYPGMADKEQAIYVELIKQAASTEVREELIAQYLAQLKDVQIRQTIAVMAMDQKIPNTKLLEQMGSLVAQEATNVAEQATEYITTSLLELIEEEENSPGLNWRLGCLNRSLGPLKKGQLIGILARVEVGKTALWVSETSYMASQLSEEEDIAVFFNEENGRDVMWRIYSAVCGKSAAELEANPVQMEELFYSRGGGRIKFIDRAVQTTNSIYKILDTLNPRLIVIDNMDKIKGFTDERRDTALGKVWAWGRETAKTYAPVLGISQAVAPPGGYHKQWLTEMDMADSKTAKPGELDGLIAIGKRDDAGYEFVRYLNIPKNKRRGSRTSDEKDRHGKFSTIIVPELSIYRDS